MTLKVLVKLILFCHLMAAVSPVLPNVPANEPRFGISFWGEAEGLPQSRIRAITQTKDGYLWLGTDNGVVRFNGATFTAFTVETGSLKDNEVWSLLEGSDGALWIGTYGGGLTRLQNGHFQTFTQADGLLDDVVIQLDKDAEGNIWIATPSGVNRYAKGVFTPFATKDGLVNNYINTICAGASGGVFAAVGHELYRFADGKFSLTAGIVNESDGVIEHLLSSKDGSLWVSFSNAVIKNRKDGVTTAYHPQAVLTSHITALYEDSNKNIWASAENGLYWLRDGEFRAVPLESGAAGFGIIYALFVDREENIWLGLQTNGLGRLRIGEFSTISIADGLHNESTRSVFEDSRGNLWIGTLGGFSIYKHESIVNYVDFAGGRIPPVRSFAEDTAGSIWIGAGNSLLLMTDGKLSKFPGWLPERAEIEVIYKDAAGRMWIGTDGDGLFFFENGKFTNFQTADGLAGNHIRGILSDRQGNLWISCFQSGISQFANGKFTNFTALDGLAGNRVLALYEDDQGTLWFATREGLSRFKDGKFLTYTAESGLFVGFIYTILDDDKGNFWFSCAKGLFRVSKNELNDFAEGRRQKITSVDYGVRDGMKTRAFNLGNQPAAWKRSDGTLAFSSLKGLVIVNPALISASNFVPPVYIEEVAINREKYSVSEQPQIPGGSGEVEIHFAALSYHSPEKLRFKYKLEGFDDNWIDAETRRSVYYTNLPPGEYKFQVTAGNIDGVWNEEGATFSFYLQPRFYQTGWFIILIIVAVILLIGLVYRHRMTELKARYSAVLAERKRIAIEIHDTLAQNLAGIALQLDSVSMELADPNGMQESLDQACNLIRYSLSEARRAVSDLHSDETGNRQLVKVLPEIADRMTAHSKSRLNLQITGAPRKLNPAVEKNLLRIFQEALSNAVKHSEAQNIKIELRYEIDQLILKMHDDGKGFDAESVMPLEVGHYGLIGMRERAARIGGNLILRSAPGAGTAIIVEIPFSKRGVLPANVKSK